MHNRGAHGFTAMGGHSREFPARGTLELVPLEIHLNPAVRGIVSRLSTLGAFESRFHLALAFHRFRFVL
jgi:hypothetical protein